MKSLKESFFVKTVYAYANLLKWAFPFLFVLGIFTFPFITTSLHRSDLNSLGSFKDEKLTSGALQFYNFSSAINIVFNLLFFFGAYLAIIRLNQFLKNVYNEKPFEEENGKHLRFIGIVTIVITILYHINMVLLRTEELPGSSTFLKILYNMSIILGAAFNPYLILGLFGMVLGEVIIHAARLKQENDLTV